MNWKSVTIGDTCMRTKQRDPRTTPGEKFSYIDISGIDREAKCITESQQLIGAEAPSRARKVVKASDILVSTVRPNLNAIAMVPHELDGQIASTGFCVLRADHEQITPRFLFYKAMTPEFVNYLTARVRGANYPAVTDGIVKSAPLLLPASSEQTRIVEILDQANQLRKLRAEADKKAERILPALFIKMFGNPAMHSNSADPVPLGQLVIINPKKSELKCGTLKDDDLVSFMPMNAIDDRWGRITTYATKPLAEVSTGYTYFREGDVLFAKITPCMENGKAVIASTLNNGVGFGSTEYHVLRARPAVSPEWIYGLIRLPIFRQLAKARFTGAVGQQRVPANFLESFMVPKPGKDEVIKFSEITQSFHLHIERAEQTSNRLNTLFSLLLHKAFSGELTATWREAHMKELLEEMEHQTKNISAAVHEIAEL
ncbi:MAG TPA: restriction endonuclease subunit S [Gammaproteobacteria bacterium]|nr:restriction endonuclease subunit S [Gammaproteobacteria bacterium]